MATAKDKDTKAGQTDDQPQPDKPAGDPSEAQQGVPQYNQAGQELGEDGAPVDGPEGLIMTKQDGTVTTAEKENEQGGGQDS